MKDLYFDVQGIGRVKLIQECGASLIVEDESGTRLSLPASRCTVSDQTAAALADQFTGRAASIAACDRALAEVDALLGDQFTGADMGEQMAAAEGYRVGDPHATDAADPAAGDGFNHSAAVASVGQAVLTAVGVGIVEWLVPTPGGWVYGVQSVECPESRIQVLLGDEFELARG